MAEAERSIEKPPISRASAGYARLSALNDRYSLARRLAILLTVVALAAAFATYAAITGTSPLGADTRTILILKQF